MRWFRLKKWEKPEISQIALAQAAGDCLTGSAAESCATGNTAGTLGCTVGNYASGSVSCSSGNSPAGIHECSDGNSAALNKCFVGTSPDEYGG